MDDRRPQLCIEGGVESKPRRMGSQIKGFSCTSTSISLPSRRIFSAIRAVDDWTFYHIDWMVSSAAGVPSKARISSPATSPALAAADPAMVSITVKWWTDRRFYPSRPAIGHPAVARVRRS